VIAINGNAPILVQLCDTSGLLRAMALDRMST